MARGCRRSAGGFGRDGGGVAAALVEDGAETGLVLEMSRRDETPLDCPGPDVGS